MSGLDEQHQNVTKCLSCRKNILAWSIYTRRALDHDLRYGGFYNSTDKYNGPSYRYSGSIDAIYAFSCTKCNEHVKRGTPFFTYILKNMLESRRIFL